MPPTLPSFKKENQSSENNEKAPFDKKKWRYKKYSKKYKLEQWEQHTRKTALWKYHRELKKESSNCSKKLPWDTDSSISKGIPNSYEPSIKDKFKRRKLTALQAAQLEYKKKCEEKKQKRDLYLKKEAEKREALQKYRTVKMERYKTLSKKTCKGQPIMGDRMKLLLQKIQQYT